MQVGLELPQFRRLSQKYSVSERAPNGLIGPTGGNVAMARMVANHNRSRSRQRGEIIMVMVSPTGPYWLRAVTHDVSDGP
ncbi:uncharacterized protein CANTADRAFT_207342 [Suhomyces tanzawaensis NRRL Y-17324]|uniref:Uncharacterized protein n=1 Tax=Suhomyces tanzawaensis NRRL Y-17324 TaxID=984487 RepID=A0A1E4SJM3_9ASCO|nr:uncharacterized protein CANTADRAFT_207342 [Suhomyces tanzawaensis NRRL Y-17324]ODV79632.1 hypothetical protein CANTADRAFT_207342 [Suhomyces tanzawaensis NRRL Y-17324]